MPTSTSNVCCGSPNVGDGNPIVFEDANTHTTSESFDLLNELSTTTLPDQTLTETRAYDSNGNLKTVEHFNGVTTTYTYDTLNRLLSRTTPGEPTVSFTYTATGKRATMTDAGGQTTYNYDNMDRLSSKVTPEGTLSYTYDAAGNLASIASSNANGASMSYTYDSLNRVSSVTDKLGTTNYTYDGASNLYTATYPNSVQAQYSYDTLNRISGLATQQSGYTYQRGPTGNLTNASELNGRQVTWSFDGIYRLTTELITGDPVSQNNGNLDYGLDPVGNRTSASSTVSGLAPVSGTYNADDELSSETYDQDGNVTAAEGKTFSYDSQNELVTMNGGAVQMLYDGDGNRVAKSANGVVTRYLVDGLNPTDMPQVMDELNGSGVVTRTYTYGLQRISENQIVNGAWTPSFYSYDEMNNVRQLTSTAGALTDTYEYDAFGNEITHSGTTPNNYLYRDEQWDSDLGLYYLRARYYNPMTDRFMSRDPLDGDQSDPRTLHKYLYAEGDPVDESDPTGESPVETPVAPPARSTGAGVEYAAIIGEISLGAISALPPIAEDVNCILYRAAAVVGLASSDPLIQIQQYGCTATGTGPGNNPGPAPGPEPGPGQGPGSPPPPPPQRKKCPELHPNLPINYVFASSTPEIAAHIKAAQLENAPDELTYLGPNSPERNANYRAVCGGKAGNAIRARGKSCDEYPYASTEQGGVKPWTTIAGVPIKEQLSQGGTLKNFYDGLAKGDNFCVVVVP